MDHTFTDNQRATIAGRARPLHERIASPAEESADNQTSDSEELIRKWREMYPSESAFNARIGAIDAEIEDIESAICADRWLADEPFPDWIDTLESLVGHVETASLDERTTVADEEDLPFIDLLLTIVDFATNRTHLLTLGNNATEGLRRYLLQRLNSIAVRPLYVEFKSFVEYHNPNRLDQSHTDFVDPPTTLYEQFIDAMHRRGFSDLCVEYPVLARQFVHLVTQWTEAVEELDERITKDLADLRERFGVEGSVTAVETLANDSHQGGRVPARVSFSSGAVVYKPRSVAPGQWFHETVSRLTDDITALPDTTPRYLIRDGYGWMSVVPESSISDTDEAATYYEQTGALSCLAYVLNFNDLQFENVVANGSTPTIVDCETLFHPKFGPSTLPHPVPPAIITLVTNSVLLTELLPWFLSDPWEPRNIDGRATIAALGSDGNTIEMDSAQRPVIAAANTDLMTVEMTSPEVDPTTSIPSIEDKNLPADGFVDDICEGFEEAYCAIINRRDRGEWDGKIVNKNEVTGIKTRALFRPSARYGEVLQAAKSRECLRDGVRFSIELEELAVPFFTDEGADELTWPLFHHERESLYRFDIPRFGSRPGETKLYHDESATSVEVPMSGGRVVEESVDTLDKEDMREQCRVIRECFQVEPSPDPVQGEGSIDDDQLRAVATEAIDDVIESAVLVDSHREWASPLGTGERLTLVPVDLSVYNGRGGIAIGSAALYRTTGVEHYRSLAVETMDRLLDEYVGPDGPVPKLLRHGGTMGIGSMLYALSVVGQLCDVPRYQKRAVDLATMLNEGFLTREGAYDIMKGTAGTLLGLLATYDRTDEEAVLDKAIMCGEHLLEERTSIDGADLWLTTDSGHAMGGFAHGVDGIGYALSRLFEACGDDRFADAARTAMLADVGSKYSHPHDANEVGTRDWCWGPSGQALARIGAGKAIGDSSMIERAENLLERTIASEQSPYDHLCCGNFGRVEALLVADEAMGRESEAARELAARCVDRRDQEGTFSLPGHSSALNNPTFFNGLSGAAYTLLRVRSSEKLPSVALLE